MAIGVNTGNVKEIKTEYLKIQGNCLELPETCIQLSNISLFTTSDLEGPSPGILVAAAVMLVIGLSVLKGIASIGLLLIALGVAAGCYWYFGWKKAKNSKRLTIMTNAGFNYSIVFEDRNFLNKVVSVITEIVRDPHHESKVIFDMKNSTFVASAIGDHANVTGGK